MLAPVYPGRADEAGLLTVRREYRLRAPKQKRTVVERVEPKARTDQSPLGPLLVATALGALGWMLVVG